MKKAIPIVIVVIVIAGVVIFADKNKSNNKPMVNMNSSNSSNNSNAQATDKVTISSFSFSPSSITIKKGTTVTWTNHDSVAHTVQETDSKAGPNSGDINNGQSYSFTYATVGTFAYHCSIHPEMTGKVTVTD